MTLYRILLTLSFSALLAMALKTPSLGGGGGGRTTSSARDFRGLTATAPFVPPSQLLAKQIHGNRPPLNAATNIQLATLSGHAKPAPQLGGSAPAVAMRAQEAERAQEAMRAGVGKHTKGSSVSIDTTGTLSSKTSSGVSLPSTALNPTELDLASPELS